MIHYQEYTLSLPPTCPTKWDHFAGRRRTAEQDDTDGRDGWVKMEAGTADVPRPARRQRRAGLAE